MKERSFLKVDSEGNETFVTEYVPDNEVSLQEISYRKLNGDTVIENVSVKKKKDSEDDDNLVLLL